MIYTALRLDTSNTNAVVYVNDGSSNIAIWKFTYLNYQMNWISVSGFTNQGWLGIITNVEDIFYTGTT